MPAGFAEGRPQAVAKVDSPGADRRLKRGCGAHRRDPAQWPFALPA
jgi:hypothetical protein